MTDDSVEEHYTVTVVGVWLDHSNESWSLRPIIFCKSVRCNAEI